VSLHRAASNTKLNKKASKKTIESLSAEKPSAGVQDQINSIAKVCVVLIENALIE